MTGLASNTAYTFQVRAASVAGPGAVTDSVTATPSPAKPVGFTAEAGDGQVTLSWTKASDASITGYQFKQGTNAWAKITDSGPATVEHTVTGLSNGTAYTFQIRAMQGAVEGAESDPVTATPVAAAAQPTGLAATANHLGATLTWTDPSDSTITAYQFRQSADGGTTWNPDWAEITGSTGTTVEHTVTGLTNGTEYTFQIRAMRGNVASVATGSVTATPGPAAPAAPADFSATSGDGSAILSWTAAADNGSPITKYQYQQDSGAWTDIDASATSFTVTGLTNDVEYTFKLRAVNNIGEGAESDAVSATPIALPVAPINLMITKITVFSSTVTLGWSNPGNSSITGYQVRQSHSVDSAGDRVWGIWESFLSSVHTESTNVRVSYGIEYAFQIRAVNAAGAGAASDTVTAALPSAKPANFAATEGDGQVKLSWTNPNDGTITGYEVQQSTDGGTTWDPAWAEIVGSSRTTVEHTVTGLTNGTTYTFQIRAMQGTLTGAESDTVTATPSGKGSPLAPTGFSAASGDESANLSWTAADDNGSPITRYQYQQDGGDWTDITASAPGGANAVSFTVTGLANGIVYVFKLRAVNSGGAGAATGEASATPVAAQTTEINLWSATLTVGKNSDYPWYGFGGNSDNTKYGAITPNSFTYNGETYDIDVLVLDQGGDTLYFIALFPFALKDSINLTVGSGSFSGAAASISSGGDGFTWSTSPGLTWAVGAELAVSLNLNVTTPDAPTSFAATAGPGKVDLAWANPSDFTITKYQYRQSADGGSNWSPDWTDISGSGVSTTTSEVTGLTAGTAYTFQVRAVNAAGSGAVSEAAPVTPDAAAPLAPPRLIAGGQDGIALLFWGAADDNGSPITGYQYRQKEGAGDFGAWTDIIDSAPGGENALSFTVTGLTNGTVYTFEVRAANNVGPGAETGERNAVPQSVPLAPTGFSATRGDGSAILRWTAAFNNGSPITKYQYQQDGAWTDIPSSAPGGGNENSYTVTSLTNGTTYTFKLRAVSNLGNGAEPGQASATPAPAQSTETTLWSATLTVGKHSVLANEWYGFGKNPDDTTYGKIAPDSFTLGDTTYSVVSLISTQSTIDTLFFRVSNPVSFRNVMTLTVGGTTFRGSVVSTTSHRNSGMTWTADPGLTWAVGDTVAVSLKALPPNAPGSFSATAGPLRAELAWTDPDDANITKYQYRQKEGNGDFGNWTNITGSGATTTSHTVAGLTAGIAYTFQVRAVNAAGPGAVSETVPVTPLAAAPLAPPGFRATSGDGSAILYWGAADDNGSPITKYQYQQDGGAWTDIPDSDANTVEYTVTGLTNGAVYAFKLLAVNSIGAGAETDAVTATPLPPPGAPSGLTATANRLEVWPESHLPGFA